MSTQWLSSGPVDVVLEADAMIGEGATLMSSNMSKPLQFFTIFTYLKCSWNVWISVCCDNSEKAWMQTSERSPSMLRLRAALMFWHCQCNSRHWLWTHVTTSDRAEILAVSKMQTAFICQVQWNGAKASANNAFFSNFCWRCRLALTLTCVILCAHVCFCLYAKNWNLLVEFAEYSQYYTVFSCSECWMQVSDLATWISWSFRAELQGTIKKLHGTIR